MTKPQLYPFQAGRVVGILAFVFALAVTAPGVAQSTSGLTLTGGYDSVVYFDFSVIPNGPPLPVTAMTLDPQNRVVAAEVGGRISILIDANQDGIAESSIPFYDNATNHLSSVTDILWLGTKLFVCHMGMVTTLQDTNADDVADVVTDIVVGLPTGFHQNNGLLADGPNHLLITNGSSTDLGPEPNPLNAAVLRCDLNGNNLTVYASGIRNCFRLARHPATGDVFGGDNEWNVPPPTTPPTLPPPPLKGDEINRIVQGADYGFPAFFGAPPNGSTTVAPAIILPEHVAPTGLAFNPNLKISGAQNELYVTFFTQGLTAVLFRTPIWYGPVSGTPLGYWEFPTSVFAAGFTNPIDVEFLPDGSMLVADFGGPTTKIHRIFPLHDATLIVEAPPIIGTTCPIRLRSPTHPGSLVFMAASDAAAPTLSLGGNLIVYLDITSPVCAVSITPGNPYFNFPVPGVLNAVGEYVAGINIPLDPALVGLDVWLSYVVLDPNWVALETSPKQSIKILPMW